MYELKNLKKDDGLAYHIHIITSKEKRFYGRERKNITGLPHHMEQILRFKKRFRQQKWFIRFMIRSTLFMTDWQITQKNHIKEV